MLSQILMVRQFILNIFKVPTWKQIKCEYAKAASNMLFCAYQLILK